MKKQICLSCALFKLTDPFSGTCRLPTEPGTHGKEYPLVKPDHSCPSWKDSGQNYFIRKGWIRAQLKQETL